MRYLCFELILMIFLMFGCEINESERFIEVQTGAISNITENSCIALGTIVEIGKYDIVQHGHCWSLSEDPTIYNDHTQLGPIKSKSNFESTITGLIPATFYYLRAYATTSTETVYGDLISFKTCNETGTITDIDGNMYKTVKIGDQWWMAENLKTTKYSNGDVITDGTGCGNTADMTEPKYWFVYNNNLDYVATYGRLYTWYVVTDSRNVCPNGWHVPTDAEWNTLHRSLGSVSVAGGKMKETGTAHWLYPNAGATNESGFTELPGGEYNCVDFLYISTYGLFWTSTERTSKSGYTIGLNYITAGINHGYYNKGGGFSIRCLKDD